MINFIGNSKENGNETKRDLSQQKRVKRYAQEKKAKHKQIEHKEKYAEEKFEATTIGNNMWLIIKLSETCVFVLTMFFFSDVISFFLHFMHSLFLAIQIRPG